MDKGKAIGIDLGTTRCCMAVWDPKRVEVIINNQGNRTTPSMVAFTPLERLVGDDAKDQGSTNPKNTVYDAKRLIGRRFSDPCVQSDMKHWPFTVVAGNNDQPIVQVDYKNETKRFAAEQISSMVLEKMRNIADDFLRCKVTNAVITVPAYFNNAQRRATEIAANIAGFTVTRIMNEPTAAAVAYAFHTDVRSANKEKTILVFDLGGGTFDISILNVHGDNFEVKAVAGDTHLGGEDFNNRLLDHCVEHFNKNTKKPLNTNVKAVLRLRSECERAKRTLSSAENTMIAIDNLHEGLDFNLEIRRAKFEELNADLFEKTMPIVKQCLEDAKLSKEQIDEVVLVGGSTRIPKVQQLLEEFLQGTKLCKTINPDEAVAYGAAVHAAALNNEDIPIVLRDVTPLSLGIGVRVGGAVMSVVVPRNTPLPTRKENIFATLRENQSSEEIRVFEGERALTADNNFLGMFTLNGIPAGSYGRRIKIVFEVDVDGILKVSARDEGSGASNDITINYDSDRLSTEEIQRMLRDAEKFQRDDEEAKKKLVVKDNLENYIRNMRSRMKEAKMDTKVAAVINKMLNIAEEWLEEDGNPHVDEMEKKLKALKFKCMALI